MRYNKLILERNRRAYVPESSTRLPKSQSENNCGKNATKLHTKNSLRKSDGSKPTSDLSFIYNLGNKQVLSQQSKGSLSNDIRKKRTAKFEELFKDDSKIAEADGIVKPRPQRNACLKQFND